MNTSGPKSLVTALRGRGMTVQTLPDLGLTGRPDPDVVRQADVRQSGASVLVTMDLTIMDDFPGFDWSRYAIAWITVSEELRGAAFEHSKQNAVHRYAHEIAKQQRGDHYTYSEHRRSKSPPTLTTWLRRKL